MAMKLGAKWQLDAALLSRPVDLTTLVGMSLSSPDEFFRDDSLHRMVKVLLNESNEDRSDHRTKLDVLNILGNLATNPDRRGELKVVLQGVSEWFDEYLGQEQVSADASEPLLHKAMVVLLSRTFDYSLKTEDLLDLNNGNRQRALLTVVSLLEEGETCTTRLTQRQAPGEGRAAQWERQVVYERYEKPMILQLARLLRGFTHPTAYFNAMQSDDGDLTLYSVDQFSDEINGLLVMSLETELVQKLSAALYDTLFGETDELLDEEDDASAADAWSRNTLPKILDDTEHHAVACVHAFLQNLYLYGTTDTAEYQHHLLMDPMLIPHLVLPYIDMVVLEANFLSEDEGEGKSESKADRAQSSALLDGLTASLKTLIIASFKAPPTRSMMLLLREFNPTASLLTAGSFVAQYPQLLALLCLLNINMNSLDLTTPLAARGEGKHDDDDDPRDEDDREARLLAAYHAHTLLHDLALVHMSMDCDKQLRVLELVLSSGGMPVARDCGSYLSILSVLHGGCGNQNHYLKHVLGQTDEDEDELVYQSDEDDDDGRAEQKSAANERYAEAKRAQQRLKEEHTATSAAHPHVPTEASSFRLLGDLPSFDDGRSGQRLDVSLVLPSERSAGAALAQRIEAAAEHVAQNSQKVKKHRKHRKDKARHQKRETPSVPRDVADEIQRKATELVISSQVSVPPEFTCAINGHVMKDPVKSPYGHHFEKSTIQLWISTNGSVCPITHQRLEASDLVPDRTLRSKIIRWQIQRNSGAIGANSEDDLYDF